MPISAPCFDGESTHIAVCWSQSLEVRRMDQQTVPVARSKKQKPARWESQAKGGIRPETLREIRRIAAEMIAPFFWDFQR